MPAFIRSCGTLQCGHDLMVVENRGYLAGDQLVACSFNAATT